MKESSFIRKLSMLKSCYQCETITLLSFQFICTFTIFACPHKKTYIQYIEAVDNQLTLECPFISIIKSIFVTHASHPTSQSTHVTPSVFIASVSSRILTLGVDYVAS